MPEFAVVGIDLGKNVFRVVAMEACAGAQNFGCTLTEIGFNVPLMPSQYVKPYLRTQKNDFLDAEAICEAVEQSTMRFVPIKIREQLELQAVHRVGAVSSAVAPL